MGLLAAIKVLVEVDNFLLKKALKLKSKKDQLELPKDSKLINLLEAIALNNEFSGFATVNGVRQDLDYQLKNNDEVAFYPFIIGG